MNTVLTPEQIDELGPEVLPFELDPFKRQVELGEDIVFDAFIHNITQLGPPVDVITVSKEAALRQLKAGCYLWIIDKYGLSILSDAIPNSFAERGNVCHTNITGGQPALQGGELWFGDDGRVYLNNKSGRYGGNANTLRKQNAILAYFESLHINAVIMW